MPAPSSPPSPLPSDADEIEALLIEALDQLETRGPAALEDICRARPAHAAALRRRWAELEKLGMLSLAVTDELPEQLGEYRLLQRLGGGGMGIVYLARQEPLGREVALKLVRPDQLYLPGARQRFLREVQIVARLQHPGIVPIYTCGSAGHIPYFAMEHVRGCTLEQALARLAGRAPAELSAADLGAAVLAASAGASGAAAPGSAPARGEPAGAAAAAEPLDDWLYSGSYEHACARIARRVAEALDHAHARGVLHRDVKPSNVMLTPGGRVMLLDFGLAQASGTERLTRSAAQLGSLPYMPPEQLAGGAGATDARSDVYSLGVSLYQMLALALPFEAGSAAATMLAIAREEPMPLRKRNPSLSWEAETVCASAMEREPARRYANAAAFARDLDNLLAHRPIEARPPSATVRVARWAQRKPAAATGLVLGALLLIAGPAGWELQRIRAAQKLAAAYARSERDFGAALAAIGHVLREVAIDDLADAPRMQRARLKAIDRALELFAELERDRPDDPLVIAERAELHLSRSEVERDLGAHSEALREAQLAVADRRRLLALAEEAESLAQLANALELEGKSQMALGRALEALPPYDEALALLAQQRERFGASAALDDSEATARLYRAEALRGLARYAEARAELELGLARAEALRSADPSSAERVWLVARLQDDRGSVELLEGRLDEARAWSERALASYTEASRLAPERRRQAFDVASGHGSLALNALERKSYAEAEQHIDAGLAQLEPLLRDFPDSLRYLAQRRQLLGLRARARGEQGHSEEAGQTFAELAAELEQQCALEPERSDLAADCAAALNNEAAALIARRAELPRALECLERAEQQAERAAREPGRAPATARLMALVRYSRALALCYLGRLPEARAAMDAHYELAGADGTRLRYAADLWCEYALALRRERAPGAELEAEIAAAREQVLELLGRAVEAGYAEVEELASTPALDAYRSEPGFAELIEQARATRAAGPGVRSGG